MSVKDAPPPSSAARNQPSNRMVFFRQSGWMVMATLVSGICMFAVHFFSKKVPESEYAVFATMLSLLNCLAIPAIGLQMLFVQQTAAAVTESAKRQLTTSTGYR